MAHGLEVRSPLLEHRLVELAARVPTRLKRRAGVGKRILREAFAGMLPPEILRRGKAGFGVPVAEWFRGPLRGLARELVAGSRLAERGLFREDALRRILDEHLAERADHGHRLWTLAAFELWAREYLDRPSFPGPPEARS
jgi:asparagine synthase (glutamine-hydrolysing)